MSDETVIETTATETAPTSSVSAIDAALAAAKRARKVRPPSVTVDPSEDPKELEIRRAAKAEEKARLEAERLAKRAEKQTSREAKRAERDALVAERRAAREARRSEKGVALEARPSRLERAAERLPELSDGAKELFELAQGLGVTDQTALAAHLSFVVRSTQVTASREAPALAVGTQVKVIAGDPRFLGRTGQVTKVSRIRCFVAVDGSDKEAYLFITDVAPVEPAAE